METIVIVAWYIFGGYLSFLVLRELEAYDKPLIVAGCFLFGLGGHVSVITGAVMLLTSVYLLPTNIMVKK